MGERRDFVRPDCVETYNSVSRCPTAEAKTPAWSPRTSRFHALAKQVCSEKSASVVAYLTIVLAAIDIPLDDPGEFYDGPFFGPDQCSCNTVMYSMVEACQLCQFDIGGGPQA